MKYNYKTTYRINSKKWRRIHLTLGISTLIMFSVAAILLHYQYIILYTLCAIVFSILLVLTVCHEEFRTNISNDRDFLL